jgi:hypothetical protein
MPQYLHRLAVPATVIVDFLSDEETPSQESRRNYLQELFPVDGVVDLQRVVSTDADVCPRLFIAADGEADAYIEETNEVTASDEKS